MDLRAISKTNESCSAEATTEKGIFVQDTSSGSSISPKTKTGFQQADCLINVFLINLPSGLPLPMPYNWSHTPRSFRSALRLPKQTRHQEYALCPFHYKIGNGPTIGKDNTIRAPNRYGKNLHQQTVAANKGSPSKLL